MNFRWIGQTTTLPPFGLVKHGQEIKAEGEIANRLKRHPSIEVVVAVETPVSVEANPIPAEVQVEPEQKHSRKQRKERH